MTKIFQISPRRHHHHHNHFNYLFRHTLTFVFVFMFITLHQHDLRQAASGRGGVGSNGDGGPFALACSSRTLPKPRPSTSSRAAANPSTSPAPPSAYASRATLSGASVTISTRGGSGGGSSIFNAFTTTIATTTTMTTTMTTTTTTTTTTSRPNITFPTYKCPEQYDAYYCLNDATCFSVKIDETVMFNCECAIGFMGERCEYKEMDGSYLPIRPRPVLVEKAGVASGATFAMFFIFIGLTLYMRCDQSKNCKPNNRPSEIERQSVVDVSSDASEVVTAGGGAVSGVGVGGGKAMIARHYGRCRYCHDTIKRCCGSMDDCCLPSGVSGASAASAHAASGSANVNAVDNGDPSSGKCRRNAVGGDAVGGMAAPVHWQEIDTLSMSFAIKRSTKL